MTYEFQYLMHLLGAAASGKPASPPRQDLDWSRVSALAQEQQVTPLFYCAMKQNAGLGYPKEYTGAQSASVFQQVLTDCARRSAVIHLLGEMEREGIHAVVVKGFAAAANYASPECRISSDTDICVDPKDEENACDFLRRHDFSVAPRWENGHHAIARHPTMGILEVHVQLYDEIVEDVWFQAVDRDDYIQEPQQKMETADGAYYTLGDTDHLIFLALHMVKHFILCGMSLRMMLDVALTIAKHREQLDMKRFWSTLNSLNYGSLANAILWAMVQYCGFKPENFPGLGGCDDAQVQMILDDLEKGGWLGKNAEEARKMGWYEYNRQLLMKSKSKRQYQFYMLNWQHSFRLSTLFPGRKRLSRNYPFVLKYPFLVPLAWFHRLVIRGFTLLRTKSWGKPIVQNADDISEEGKARFAMFQRLEML